MSSNADFRKAETDFGKAILRLTIRRRRLQKEEAHRGTTGGPLPRQRSGAVGLPHVVAWEGLARN